MTRNLTLTALISLCLLYGWIDTQERSFGLFIPQLGGFVAFTVPPSK